MHFANSIQQTLSSEDGSAQAVKNLPDVYGQFTHTGLNTACAWTMLQLCCVWIHPHRLCSDSIVLYKCNVVCWTPAAQFIFDWYEDSEQTLWKVKCSQRNQNQFDQCQVNVGCPQTTVSQFTHTGQCTNCIMLCWNTGFKNHFYSSSWWQLWHNHCTELNVWI